MPMRFFRNIKPRSQQSVAYAIDAYMKAGMGGTLIIQISEKPEQAPEIFFTNQPDAHKHVYYRPPDDDS